MRDMAVTLLLGLVVGLFLGWKVSGWRADSVNLAVQEAAAAIREDALKRESDVAREVLESAAARAPVERVIDRGIVREVQKTEYRNVCFGPDLVRLLNDGAKGAPVGTDPGKPAGDLPGGSARAAQR